MNNISYPSPQVPATRAFTLTAPDGWEVDSFPGAILVVAEPVSDGFRANVLVDATRVGADTSLDTISVDDDPGEPILQDEQLTLDGVPARLIVRGMNSESWPKPLVRWQMITVAETSNPALRDLFMITATCEADDGAGYAEVFEPIFGSFTFVPD